jgi:hypothetical protein
VHPINFPSFLKYFYPASDLKKKKHLNTDSDYPKKLNLSQGPREAL